MHFRLRQIDVVPDGWDSALAGQHRGVSVTALCGRIGDSQEIRFNFKHATVDSPIREQLASMQFLEAVSRGGTMVITDHGKAKRPPLRMQTPSSEVPSDVRAFIALLNDLSTIEERTGAHFVLPDEISADEVRRIAEVAALVRNRARSIIWHDATLYVLEPAVEMVREGGVMSVEETASAVILGRGTCLLPLRWA